MRVSIICPSCGCRPSYSPELAREVIKVVAEYFGITVEEAQTKWKKTGLGGRVRGFSLYFLRSMTGEQYKTVGDAFNLVATRAGNLIARIEESIVENPDTKIQEEELTQLLLNLPLSLFKFKTNELEAM